MRSFSSARIAFERGAVDPRHDRAVHLQQAPVGVVRESWVVAKLAGLHDPPVETEVENRFHHSRHRDRATGPHREEQRVCRVAEPLARPSLEDAEMLGDLACERRRLGAGAHRLAARVRRDRETERDRQPKLCHLCEPETLASEERAATLARLVEVVDVRHDSAPFFSCRALARRASRRRRAPGSLRSTECSPARSRCAKRFWPSSQRSIGCGWGGSYVRR